MPNFWCSDGKGDLASVGKSESPKMLTKLSRKSLENTNPAEEKNTQPPAVEKKQVKEMKGDTDIPVPT